MKQLPFFIFWLSSVCVFGQQSLVPNASFEVLTDCTVSLYPEVATPWYSASQSADLYNECSPFPINSVPYSGTHAYQLPHTGKGYAGIIPYNYFFNEFREFLGVPLQEPLQPGKKYYAAFYCIPAIDTAILDNGFSDALGLGFFKGHCTFENQAPVAPVIENQQQLIDNRTEWTRIHGFFTAGSVATDLILGNFRNNVNTLSAPARQVSCYLYIDDVNVYEFNPLPDTLVICSGDTRQVGASFLNAKYLWNTGSTDSTIIINKAGKYIVSVQIDDAQMSDTLVVVQPSEVLNEVFTDTTVCVGSPVQVNFKSAGHYEWSTGHIGNHLDLVETGTYTVSVTNACGLYSKDIRVAFEVCDCPIYVANAFSPNDDGLHDNVCCSIDCDFEYHLIRFEIFDRWGSLVFQNESDDVSNYCWDGEYRNRRVETGVYVYSLTYEIEKNGATVRKTQTGSITVIR